VARVLAAEPLDTRFDRPRDFDLTAYWAASSEAYEREAPAVEVTVRLRPGRRGRLAGAIGERAFAGAVRLDVPDPEDWEHWRFTVPWPDEVPGRMLAVGSSLEVLEPPEIRDRVAASAARIVERYRVAGAVGTD
jgi:predicted DNA-binding transcriptional regulator YafY